MNRKDVAANVIPTPQELTHHSGVGRTFKRGALCRLAVVVDEDERGRFVVQSLVDQLRQQTGMRISVKPLKSASQSSDIDFVLCGNADKRVAKLLPPKLAKLDDLAAEQGYVIASNDASPTILFAHTPTGLLYAGSTLLQLLTSKGRNTHLPPITVKDWPAYRWRGNSWLVRAELEGWSYARGDDLRAYEKRVLRKLDLCAFHKINFLYFDGFDWDTERFPGYAKLMRRLNHAARLRGIRLSFGGYGSCSDGFENRKQYPDGPTYECLGPKDHRIRCEGTCLSNRALTRLRQERLTTFMREVQPGAIYLHGIDTGAIADSAPIWNMRCPACRKRWPNDDIFAPDGMAGAYAASYDAIAKAIHSVDPECIISVVSPCYTGHDESDADWEKASNYWVTVSNCLKDRTIHFGLREQFTNYGRAQLRYAGLRRRLDRDAKGHPISCINFFGGDCFYSSHPFLATPMVDNHFQGAELVVNGNGHAYQEPQALLNSECMWNPTGSRYFSPPKLQPYKKFERRYLRLSNAEERPRSIWGPDGFLDDACVRLYGPKAGPLVAQIHRLVGKETLGSPQIARFEHTPVMMPVFNYLHPSRKSFSHAGIIWQKKLKNKRRAERLAKVYHDTAALNRQAITLARKAARLCADSDITADLSWMADTLDAARRCAEILAPFVELFLRTHLAATSGRNTKRVQEDLARFNKRVDTFDRAMQRSLPGKPRKFRKFRKFRKQELELRSRQAVAPALRIVLSQMQETLSSGQWPEPK